jgi:2-keto-4-pentenoate hydratase/2-oxohepta-3-ene-1,7-dioic acid hydratase in catechol pathway
VRVRIATYRVRRRQSFGVLRDSRILDVGHLCGHESLREVLKAGALDTLQRHADASKLIFELSEVEFLPPVPDPERIFGIGINYQPIDATPVKAQTAGPPLVFLRSRSSFVGHRQLITRPAVSDQLDYEGEIALVIGRAGHRIPAAAAIEHVAGVTIANDGTIRDWARHTRSNIPGKNFDASGSLGPWIDTESLTAGPPLRIRTWVNGALRQDAFSDQMTTSIPGIIAYVSTFTTLMPGDILLTGTPPGSGIEQRPPSFLRHGDAVTVEIDGVGRLENKIVDEAAAPR